MDNDIENQMMNKQIKNYHVFHVQYLLVRLYFVE